MTRREQFIKRQNRYRRRRERMYALGFQFEFIGPTNPFGGKWWRRTGRVTPLWGGPLQYRGRLAGLQGTGPLTPPIDLAPLTYHVTDARQTHWPYVSWTGFARVYFPLAGPRKQRRMFIGFQRRRLHAIGHKPDRMNGFQRKCWGAAYLAYSNGSFPEWDPLQRHPTDADLDNGDPPYSGPFPTTPGH